MPKETIEGFVKIVKDDNGTSGQVMKQLSAFVRKEIRDKQLFYVNTKYDPAEEFFKLALEAGYHSPHIIHKQAKSIKKTDNKLNEIN